MAVQSDRTRWARGVGRAIAALWARLRGALRRWAPALPQAGAMAGALPAASPTPDEDAPQAMTQAPAGSTSAVEPVIAPVVQEVALVIEEAPPRPAGRRADPVIVEPVWNPELGTMRVRQFFGRIVMAAPGAAEVDLGEWPQLSVERFFLAIGSPRALTRREPPTGGGEAMSLGNAFEGFEWD